MYCGIFAGSAIVAPRESPLRTVLKIPTTQKYRGKREPRRPIAAQRVRNRPAPALKVFRFAGRRRGQASLEYRVERGEEVGLCGRLAGWPCSPSSCSRNERKPRIFHPVQRLRLLYPQVNSWDLGSESELHTRIIRPAYSDDQRRLKSCQVASFT